jgi:hypothetical protein
MSGEGFSWQKNSDGSYFQAWHNPNFIKDMNYGKELDNERYNHEAGGFNCTDICYFEHSHGGYNEIKEASSYKIPQNQIIRFKGRKHGGGDGVTYFGSIMNSVDIPTIDGYDENGMRQAIWAPIMDREYIKFNCCLGNIDHGLCEQYGINDKKSAGECRPYLENYCKNNKLPYTTQDYSKNDLPALPTKKGCWSIDPALNTPKWVKHDDDKTMCMQELPFKLAKDNIGSVDWNYAGPGKYKAPVVFWVNDDLVNTTHMDMNQKTTETDKRFCGCAPDAKTQQNDAQIKAHSELTGVVGTLQNEICRLPYCGKQHTNSIPWLASDAQQECPDQVISINHCIQNVTAEAVDAATVSGIEMSQQCNSVAQSNEIKDVKDLPKVTIVDGIFKQDLTHAIDSTKADEYLRIALATTKEYTHLDHITAQWLNDKSIEYHVYAEAFKIAASRPLINDIELLSSIDNKAGIDSSSNVSNMNYIIILLLVVVLVAAAIFTYTSSGIGSAVSVGGFLSNYTNNLL